MLRRSLPAPASLLICCLFPGLLAITGCASPGQPRPPSLHIPAVAKGLRAERIGPAVHLSWSTPDDSTDGQGIRGTLLAVLCRDTQPAHKASTECHRVGSVAVLPGNSTAEDQLPPALLTGPPVPLSYQIQLFSEQGRSTTPSAPAYTAGGAAPPPVGPLTASPARGAVLLRWTPSASPAPVELQRTLVAAAPKPASSKPSSSATPGTLPGSRRAGSGNEPPAPVLLRAEPTDAAPTSDTGGLRDPGVHAGDRYRYVAQRVEVVTLAGPAGPLTAELRSLPSPPAEVTFRDVFPPEPPTGLVALGMPGDSGSTPPVPPSVDLSWEGSVVPDLLGYYVSRARGGSTTFERLNAVPLPGPAFHDAAVHTGETFLYRVSAVDRAGNESAPSASVRVTIPTP